MIKVFLVGWVVLFVAITVNFLALKLGISTWYPFFDLIQKNGFLKSFKEISVISKLFLFIIYPLILGYSAFLSLKFFK